MLLHTLRVWQHACHVLALSLQDLDPERATRVLHLLKLMGADLEWQAAAAPKGAESTSCVSKTAETNGSSRHGTSADNPYNEV